MYMIITIYYFKMLHLAKAMQNLLDILCKFLVCLDQSSNLILANSL